ncbi:MAG TPA: hypothetical protein VF576_07610, partial [Rubricoccaceae bacterium]
MPQDRLPLSTVRPASSVKGVVAGAPLTLPLSLTGDDGAPVPLAGRTVVYELRTASGALHDSDTVAVDDAAGGLVTVSLGPLQTTQGGVYFLRVYVRDGAVTTAALPAGGEGLQVVVPGAGSADLTVVKRAAELAPYVIRLAPVVTSDAVRAESAALSAEGSEDEAAGYALALSLGEADVETTRDAVTDVVTDHVERGVLRGHLQAGVTGAGTEADPYVSPDGKGGVQVAIWAARTAGGGHVLLSGRTDVTDPDGLLVDRSGLTVSMVAPGANADPNGTHEGFRGDKLRFSGDGFVFDQTGFDRVSGVHLRDLYLWGEGAYAARGVHEGRIGLWVRAAMDQPHIGPLVNLGGWDVAVLVSGTPDGAFDKGPDVDLSYFDKVNILGGRIGVLYDRHDDALSRVSVDVRSYYHNWTNGTIADTEEHGAYVNNADVVQD